ncbi:ATP-binding protein [Sphingomonas sp. ST-64]|uniref:ATP-binding protein n=1 Tax=Sphingomonas plantiphila TaxID=3163295 RepID=A0ABW8YKN3_9SPHN
MALREAVTNVIRHAGATRCTIRFAHDIGQIYLDIADDGQGGHFREGAGIAGMRARMTAAGGAFVISASPAGTTVLATVPASA